VDDYCSRLLDALQYLNGIRRVAVVALLSPGIYNSAYFEHSFSLSRWHRSGEGRDLVRLDGFVTSNDEGFERIDVLYRRIDDDFLDRCVSIRFAARVPRIDGGVPRGANRARQRAGNGIADDKVMYAYVPQAI
jgi:uncharacterized circularly permuted ATP-grasp superfamily protein